MVPRREGGEKQWLNAFEIKCSRSMAGVNLMNRVRNEEAWRWTGVIKELSDETDMPMLISSLANWRWRRWWIQERNEGEKEGDRGLDGRMVWREHWLTRVEPWKKQQNGRKIRLNWEWLLMHEQFLDNLERVLLEFSRFQKPGTRMVRSVCEGRPGLWNRKVNQ